MLPSQVRGRASPGAAIGGSTEARANGARWERPRQLEVPTPVPEIRAIAPDSSALESRRDGGRSLGRRHDGMDLEFDDIGPVLEPRVEETAVVALHDLKALSKVVGHPAVHVLDAGWSETPAVTEATVHGKGIAVAEPLDDHEEHDGRVDEVLSRDQ